MTEEFREDGASEESIGQPDAESSSPKRRTIGTVSLFIVAGMSLLLTLRKSPRTEEAQRVPGGRTTLVAGEQIANKSAFTTASIEIENGEKVPFRFIDDGFILQVDRRFFYLRSISLGFFQVHRDNIRFNIGEEGITKMEYDTDDTLVIEAGENVLRIPPEKVSAIIGALHTSDSADTSYRVDNVTFDLSLDPKNTFKNVIPAKGSMSVSFWNMDTPPKQKDGNLTAQSK
ncbi:hypothetical protein K8942_02085 [Candidatus Peribacteria bacterium]|nr:MAG: hypothetical protein K8942_02085 [Candidatus Peribacteria bacterium]